MVPNKTTSDDAQIENNEPSRFVTTPVGAVVCTKCGESANSGAQVREYTDETRIEQIDSYIACESCIDDLQDD